MWMYLWRESTVLRNVSLAFSFHLAYKMPDEAAFMRPVLLCLQPLLGERTALFQRPLRNELRNSRSESQMNRLRYWTWYCVACQWTMALCIKCRSIENRWWRFSANNRTVFTDEMRMTIACKISCSPSIYIVVINCGWRMDGTVGGAWDGDWRRWQ